MVPELLVDPGKDMPLGMFRSWCEASASEAPFFRTALLIGSLRHPDLDTEWWRPAQRRLTDLVAEARDALEAPPAPLTQKVQIRRLALWFRDRAGFAGNTEDYSAPENSYLDHVLESRRGLPITLSVTLAAIGTALRLNLYGVGAPGHFLTGARLENGEVLYLDPFTDSEMLDAQQAADRVAARMNIDAQHILPFLSPTEPRQILVRMLSNLKMSFRERGDLERLLRVVNWLLALEPGNMSEVRNRGLLLLRLGAQVQGAQELLRYVEGAPDAEDLEVIRGEAMRILAERSRWN